MKTNKSQRAILSLSWHSMAYGLGTIGSQLVSYFLLPILTHTLSKEEYGVIPVAMSLFAFLNTITNAGLPSATYHFYSDKEYADKRKLTLGTSQFLFFIFAAIPALIIFFWPRAISALMLNSENYAKVFQLVAMYLVTETMIFFGGIILRIQMRSLVSSLHTVFMIALKMGLAILFVVKYNLGVTGYWLGYLIGSAVSLAVMIWLVRGLISFDISWSRISILTVFGLPLIPAAISTTLLRIADRYIITALNGLDQVAVYDIGYKIGSLILMLIGPFRSAWTPFAFSMVHKPEAKKIFRDVLAFLLAGCTFVVLGLIAFRSEITFMLAPISYQGAISVIGWVAVSHLFVAAYPVLSISLISQKKGYHLAWIAVVASGINIALNYILIPRIGILGAAIATFVGYGILTALSYHVGKRWFDMEINWLKMGKIAVAAIPVYFSFMLIETFVTNAWLAIILKVVGLIIFPLLLLAVRFVKPGQINEILELSKIILNRRKEKQEPVESDAL